MLRPEEFYDCFAPDYGRMINWEARLDRELLFLERLFRGRGVRRVLDAGCGTGQHVVALAQRGYEAEGADISLSMLRSARTRARDAGVRASFRRASFSELPRAFPAAFDAVLCLGNTLPHLLTLRALRGALRGLFRVLSPGGLLLIQNLNYDRRTWRSPLLMPLNVRQEGGRTSLFLRLTEPRGRLLQFTVLILEGQGSSWEVRRHATALRPWRRKELVEGLMGTGFRKLKTYGDYRLSPYRAKGTKDLVILAER